MKRLIRLYPAQWRQRYGGEVEQLVDDLRGTVATRTLVVDLLRGALEAHIQERLEMQAVDWKAARRGALIAGVVGFLVAVEIVLTNVVFPSTTDDDTVSVVVSYLSVFAAMILAGVLAARDGAGPRGQIVAGAVTGAIIGALVIATFLVVDNIWLDIVSQQQTKIDGFAHSGASSMRAFINQGLIGPGVFFIVGFGLFGALLSRTAGALSRPRAQPGVTHQ
jgi:hypothetical protein